MKEISDVLFIVSNGLLLPVVLLLVCLLVRAFILLAGFYSVWRRQRRVAAAFAGMVRSYSDGVPDLAAADLDGMEDCIVVRAFRDMVAHRADRDYCDHVLADLQVDVQKKLSANRTLIKFGPMLGLMGTLIPMGPALVGLAAGDITSMAYNMQVAFATTVVGMAVAAIGLATLQVRRRFYARSFNDLEYLYHKLIEI